MDTIANTILGFLFLLLAAAGTFLMYKLWSYPFDHKRLKSSAPPRLMRLHRLIGYAYAGIYIFLMFQMVPRLFTYEVEFPARTVAHLMLGMSIGIILVIKMLIVRFFKHLESTLVPFLGTALLVCTFLLVGLSVPFALKDVYLHQRTVGGTAFSAENIARVRVLVPKAGFPPHVPLEELSSVASLKQGRNILLTKCVECHDLRTVLLKPRTPENWVQTVGRMADRAIFNPIGEEEQWRVSAYLIAISPVLQETFKQKRQQEADAARSRATADAVARPAVIASVGTGSFDPASAREVFEETCTQCHGLGNLDRNPPRSPGEVADLIERMVDNGLEATREELEQIMYYLSITYAK
jgi:mono/diheme cytochrome c family protein